MSKLTFLIDVSRTVARARLPVPTGIDRVERAYIDWALGKDSRFLAKVDAKYYVLNADTLRTLIGWLDGAEPAPSRDLRALLRPKRSRRLTQAQSLIRRNALSVHTDPTSVAQALGSDAHIAYLNVGHDNCTVELMEAFGSAGFVRLVMVHDTIPLDHPEFARPETPAKFRAMLDAARLADGLLAISDVTNRQISTHLKDVLPPCWTAPLGIEVPGPETASPYGSDPFFLCIGTIEPRKNHDLLLRLWKKMHQERRAEEIPHLHIVGRRGWLNEDIFRDLDTLPFIGKTVFEATLDDVELAQRMASAHAVLFPSFAEGYGLPLAEALAAGTPVISSDLPVLREIGGNVPEFLPPDDPGAWLQTIEDYAQPNSERRDAQVARIATWFRPTWEQHFSIVENAIETILVQTDLRR